MHALMRKQQLDLVFKVVMTWPHDQRTIANCGLEQILATMLNKRAADKAAVRMSKSLFELPQSIHYQNITIKLFRIANLREQFHLELRDLSLQCDNQILTTMWMAWHQHKNAIVKFNLRIRLKQLRFFG